MKLEELIISEIVKRYGFNLVISGNSYKILCPFHTEKTPSLLLNDQRGTYYCFGCGESGNIYTLFKFLDSTVNLKKGLKIRGDQKKDEKLEKQIFRNPYFKKNLFFSKLSSTKVIWMLQLAWGFYMMNLKKNKLLKVLVYSRGISVCSSKIYGLGFAPDGKNELVNFLNQSGFNLTEIIQSGIVYSKRRKPNVSLKLQKNYKGDFTDVFRYRLVIPIRNNCGVIVGFGGRMLGKARLAKYINSSDSSLFKKKRILFSKEIISSSNESFFRMLIVTEGYMDSIGLFQNGIKFTSASLGTSFGNFQFERLHLNSLNSHTMVYFDADNAGKMATKKILNNTFEKLIENYLCISIAYLDFTGNAKDPDEFVYYQGSINLTEKVFNFSLPIIKWYENILIKDMKRAFVDFLCLDELNKKGQFLVEKKNYLINENFFKVMVLKISKVYSNSPKQNQTLNENGPQVDVIIAKSFSLTKNKYFFKNKKLDYSRSCNKSEDIKNQIFLYSLLFPAYKDDLLQIFTLNEFSFLNYADKCSRKQIYTTVFNIKILITWKFYEIICTCFSITIAKPEYLKRLFLFQFNPKHHSSFGFRDTLLIGNSYFCIFFFSLLIFKEKKLKEEVKTIRTQIFNINLNMKGTEKTESNLILKNLNHRKNRLTRILKISNYKQ